MKLGMIVELMKKLFQKPMTVCYPFEKIEIPEGYRGEHEFDITKCKSCKQCARICPNRAIEMIEAPPELKEKYPKTYPKIDLGKCCFCRLCQDICPEEAIVMSKNFDLATFDSKSVIKNPFPVEV
ncbi:MAG: NuoI/complex I 23 kDa subunit family protein [Candidatus Hodarchaeales archaeon]